MPNYENGLIYKLCCKDANITDIYIGSTTSFRHRKSGHKSACNNENRKGYNRHVYKFIRENGGFLNWDMILVEYYPSKTKLQLEKREREIIENLKPTLNKTIPTRTGKEWYDDNKETMIRIKKNWRDNNKEKIKGYYEENKEQKLEKAKEHYEENKEQILEKAKEYYEKNKEQISEKSKKRYEENKEQIKERTKEYRQNNKEQIKEKITCECGSIINKDVLARHKKTNKHNGYIALKNNIDNI